VTYDDGAMVEPVAEALHTCLRAGITVESEVLILGADPVGLSSLLVAKAMCARHVCIAGTQFTLATSSQIKTSHLIFNVSGY